MLSIHTKPFIAGNSQAVRLPKEFAYPDGTPLILSKDNGVITIRPVTNLSDVPSLFADIGKTVGEIERAEFDDAERAW
ncbi:MAG: hypothetical protein Q4C68_05160 [Moraxella sp.]|nr:hypothetical protein [Moraxella sp.]